MWRCKKKRILHQFRYMRRLVHPKARPRRKHAILFPLLIVAPISYYFISHFRLFFFAFVDVFFEWAPNTHTHTHELKCVWRLGGNVVPALSLDWDSAHYSAPLSYIFMCLTMNLFRKWKNAALALVEKASTMRNHKTMNGPQTTTTTTTTTEGMESSFVELNMCFGRMNGNFIYPLCSTWPRVPR